MAATVGLVCFVIEVKSLRVRVCFCVSVYVRI